MERVLCHGHPDPPDDAHAPSTTSHPLMLTTLRGTEVAALFYSLIESAKLCGVDPTAYLLNTARTARETPGPAILPHTLRG
jgi:hypothetical protein